MGRLFGCWRASDQVFWLLALATQLPVAGPLWLAARLVAPSGMYGSFIVDLVRWRQTGCLPRFASAAAGGASTSSVCRVPRRAPSP
jgi:hypothetical protein